MKTFYCLSDIHLEFHITDLSLSNEEIDAVIGKYFETADALLFAGDAGNDIKTQIRLYEYLSWKYKDAYAVLGNHDLCAKYSSEERIKDVKEHLPKNVHLLDGTIEDSIGGTMGMCDWDRDKDPVSIFRWRHWFDGRNWKYMDMYPETIKQSELAKLDTIVKAKPEIIMTHFVPEQAGVDEQYIGDRNNKYFIFDVKDLLEKIEKDTIWVYGHTHNKRISSYTNAKGNKITFLCNPLGYGESYEVYDKSIDNSKFITQRLKKNLQLSLAV